MAHGARAMSNSPLELQGVATRRAAIAPQPRAERVGLDRFANFYPHQLSGGMKQRVGLARALGADPAYLLMDEPFGALDPQIREMMQIELLKLWDSDRKTIVLVTHSVDEAIFLSDRVIIFGTSPAASSPISTSTCRGRAGPTTRRSRPARNSSNTATTSGGC